VRLTIGYSPCLAFEPINQTIIGPECPAFDGLEAEPCIEAAGPDIAEERIDKHGLNHILRKAPHKREMHHLRPVAMAEIGFFADPDIDGAKPRFDPAPVMRFLPCGIYNLNEADGAAIALRDQ
jgi:hypothetical protein